MSKKQKTVTLQLSELEAKSLVGTLNRCFELGSYDYIFPKLVDETRAEKIRKQLISQLPKDW